MYEQCDDDVVHDRPLGRVAPIFRLLGEGRLGSEAVDAVVAVLEAEPLPVVSESRIARACLLARWPRPATLWADVGGAARRLLATLVMDLRPWAVPVGVRGGGFTGCRLLFTADGYEVVVQESRHPKRRARGLVGQILRDGDPVAGAVVLLTSPSQRTEVEADQEGCFRFQDITSGSYELDVWAGDDLIVCAPVLLDDGATRPARAWNGTDPAPDSSAGAASSAPPDTLELSQKLDFSRLLPKMYESAQSDRHHL